METNTVSETVFSSFFRIPDIHRVQKPSNSETIFYVELFYAILKIVICIYRGSKQEYGYCISNICIGMCQNMFKAGLSNKLNRNRVFRK
jgi:hypothetical protein